jgi:hypothetical protein
MHSKAKGPTKSERHRMAWMKEDGCIACRQEGRNAVQADVDHEVIGGKRTGHNRTIPLCPWHHRGIPPFNWTASMARIELGPTKCNEMREFYERFGSFSEMVDATNERYGSRVKPSGY